MGKLIIDNSAIEFLKETLKKERSDAVRIFTSGGGCCKQFEITSVRKPLTGDVRFDRNGITVYIEKDIADHTSRIEIKYIQKRGLLLEFRETINSNNS